MRRLVLIACVIALASTALNRAQAASCPHPGALGVSRVLTIDPKDYPLVGRDDYGRTLPLAPGEVVLTFDDGPIPPATDRVLQALADQCVKAVFFMVGRNARAHPEMVRRVEAAGHTIATHTQNHPLRPMSPERARYEIDAGIASVGAALGSTKEVSPFFRFPGLFHTRAAESYLRSRGISAWSIDVESDDWRRISANEVLRRILTRLAARGRGIVLMHDIHAKTAGLVPTLLDQLKARGYRVVQVVPAGRRERLPDDVVAAAPSPSETEANPPAKTAAKMPADRPLQKPAELPASKDARPAARTGVAHLATSMLRPPEIIYTRPSFIVLERPGPNLPKARPAAHQGGPYERIYMPRESRYYR